MTAHNRNGLKITYANGLCDSIHYQLHYKDKKLKTIEFPSTTSWNAFGSITIPVPYDMISINDFILTPLTEQVSISDMKYIPLYDGHWEQALHIMDAIQFPTILENTYSIITFGGCGDGSMDNYTAFKRAIEYISKQGGGKLIVPKGTYICNGPIHLLSNIELHLEDKETIVKFGTQMSNYLVGEEEHKGCILTSWEGTTLYNYSPAVYAYNQSNIRISGKGTLDQQAKDSWHKWRPHQKKDQQLSRDMNNSNLPIEERVFGDGHYLRPHMIQFYKCKHVEVRDLTLKDAGFWMIHPIHCHHVVLDGIYFDSNNLNNDGIDPEYSQFVWIKNIHFNNGDDNIAIKSGRDLEGANSNICSNNILVQHCYFNSYNAMAIGSEISAGVHDIYVEDCSFGGDVRGALYIKTNRDRGGVVEKVYMRNLTFGNASSGIKMITNYKNENTYNRHPRIKNVTIDNVYFQSINKDAIDLLGLEELPLSEIKLSNIFVGTPAQIAMAHTQDVQLENIWIDGTQY